MSSIFDHWILDIAFQTWNNQLNNEKKLIDINSCTDAAYKSIPIGSHSPHQPHHKQTLITHQCCKHFKICWHYIHIAIDGIKVNRIKRCSRLASHFCTFNWIWLILIRWLRRFTCDLLTKQPNLFCLHIIPVKRLELMLEQQSQTQIAPFQLIASFHLVLSHDLCWILY